MFRKNENHIEQDIFNGDPFALANEFKRLEKSKYYFFYKTILCNIDEERFAPLYCEDNGRPNAPANILISAIVLKEKYNWSYVELIEQIRNNLAIRTALGEFSVGTMPFDEATIFNFMNRVHEYEKSTGINLFNEVFKSLTKKQLQDLKLKTGIARTDSFMVDSNTRSYGRLELLIEVILRFYRVFSDADKALFVERYTEYEEKGAQHYIYEIAGSDLPHEHEQVAEAYYWIKYFIAERYNTTEEYENFIRVYDEQFKIDEKEKLILRDKSEVASDSLQSPDDPDATYRNKRDEKHHGQIASVTEIVDPEKGLNMIIDIGIAPNNVDDSKILNDRLPEIMEIAPDIEEIHFDGGYGSADNDEIMQEMNITQVQTAVRGKKEKVEMKVEVIENEGIELSCPSGQKVAVEQTKKNNKAKFDVDICGQCSQKDDCPAYKGKNIGTFYFSNEYILRKIRINNIMQLPLDRRKKRANVEATMHEFTYRTRGHKLKVFGAFKASLFVYATAIGINFGRIYRYHRKSDQKSDVLSFFSFSYDRMEELLYKLCGKSRLIFQF
jgi:hypothetical protein